jgi:carbamoyltransferase
VCEACGFSTTAGEEWKVMGLAAYGKFNPEIYALFREMISVEGLNIKATAENQQAVIKRKLEKFRRKKTQPGITAADLAYAGQQVFEETLFAFLNNLYARGISENLVFGGGCALNSSANGKILDRTDFKRLYVFSAPADDGNAIGAALLAHREDHPEHPAPPLFQSPWLGSSMSRETLDHVRRFGGMRQTTLDDAAVPEKAASLLAQGKIIGWIQGRAEFGPRALGNRSILADARIPNIKDLINSRVKFREEFRPFAPSILHEYGPAYFENYQESPYMERTLKFREDVLHEVPGVVHEDLTGRLQTVKREWNQRYYDLIHAFHRLTGTPLIINTSFNVMGKPIAHTVEDVLAVFYTSGLDAVFVDDVLIEK